MKTTLRILTLSLLTLSASCSDHDDGIGGGGDTGSAARLDLGVNLDAGAAATVDVGEHSALDAGGNAPLEDVGEAMDASIAIDAQAPSSDAGFEPDDAGQQHADAGALPPPALGASHRLTSRRFVCDGEAISETALTWNGGQLNQVLVREFGEESMRWTLSWREGRPVFATGQDSEGNAYSVHWSYANNLLSQARLDAPWYDLDWRFTYDRAGQLIQTRFVETADGETVQTGGRFAHGPDGPSSFSGMPITYANGRPVTVVGQPITYQGDQLDSYPRGQVLYQNGRIRTLDDQSGCAYTYEFSPGVRADYFQDSMPFSDIGSLYRADGTYHGQLNPGRWIYLTLQLLTGD
jgi:hypothetical protein